MLLQGKTFFDLINAKKVEIQITSDYNNFINDNKHNAEDAVKKIVREKI